MEFNSQGINRQSSLRIPQPANYVSFSERDRRGPDIVQPQREFYRGHDYYPHHLHPHFRPFHHTLPPPDLCNMREAIQIELEKERIREEIIMSEIARRRFLEAEVRRELMMERELAIRRSGDGFPFGPSPKMEHKSPMRLPLMMERELAMRRSGDGFPFGPSPKMEHKSPMRLPLMMERELALCRGGDGFPFGLSPKMEYKSPMTLSLLGTRADGRSPEERIAMSLEKTNSMNGRRESGGFDTPQFQRGTADLRLSEVKPVSKEGEEKQEIVFPAKPDKNISGSKRKAVTPPGVDASEPPSILKRKAKEEWSCALCQVSATSEQTMNDHLQGKKHKSNEAALIANHAKKNHINNSLFPKRAKSIQVVGTADAGAEQGPKLTAESLLFKETGNESSKKQNPDNSKHDKPESVQEVQKNCGPKNKKYSFWCELCSLGTFSQKVMNAHEKGKKHVNRLRQRGQKGGGGQSHSQKIDDV